MGVNNTRFQEILSAMHSAFKTEAYERVINLGKIASREKLNIGKSIYGLYFLGKSYEKLYDFTNAIDYYFEMLQSNAFDMKAYDEVEIMINTRIFFFTGLYLLGIEKYEKALRCFEAFLKYETQHEGAFYYAGVACLHLGRTSEAVHYLQVSIHAYEDDANYYFRLCILYRGGNWN